MMRQIISWTITVIFLMVIVGFVLTHGLNGSFHIFAGWSKDVYSAVHGWFALHATSPEAT
jgi:hypothetical protein